jgi:membrane dipeptidase
MKPGLLFISALVAMEVCFVPTSFTQGQILEFQRIHQDAIVIDTHTDTPMKLVNEQFDLSASHEAPRSRVDFPRLREGGVDAIFFALFTGQKKRIPEYYREAYDLANQMLDSTLVSLHRNKESASLATHSSEIIRFSNQGRTAVCLGMENGFPLSKDITRIREFYEKGVRYITLCHSANNDICDSSTDPQGPEYNGLSNFGQQVVAEMNRLGMIIDVSHVSDSSFFDIIDVSRAPVIASHSSVRALCDLPRNMSDTMIRSNWQYRDENERRAAWRAYDSIETFFPPVLPTIAQAVDHIDYVVKLAGIDYVGIGSDFDGGGGLADCADVADFPKITAELVKRGYTREEINKIWGGNFLRVFREVEKTAGYE